MRWARGFLLLGVIAVVSAFPALAWAGCATDPTSCMPTPPPSTATPQPTPKPTPKPTTAPAKTAAAPTQQPTSVAPVTNNQSTSSSGNSAPTQAPVDLSTPAPTAEVTVPGPAFNTLPSAPIDQVHSSASLTTWIFGFIAGFLIGALVGRASWGVSRRRRRQQIFG